jgi:hypothetical protein
MYFYHKTLLAFFSKVIQKNRFDLVSSSLVKLLSFHKASGLTNKALLLLVKLRLYRLLSFLLRTRKVLIGMKIK